MKVTDLLEIGLFMALVIIALPAAFIAAHWMA